MLFILALQQQKPYIHPNDNQLLENQFFKESMQNQSNILKDSLLKKVKQMKRQLRHHGNRTASNINNETGDELRNNLENQNEIIEDDINNLELENVDFPPENLHHEYNSHHTYNDINRHHKRCKSKGINNINLIEENQIKNINAYNEYKNCSICLENYELGDKISYLPCFHFYHSKCIKKWLKCSKRCPLCKKEVNFKNPNN